MQGAFRCAYTTCDRTFHSPSEVAAHYNTDHNYSADQPDRRYDNNEMAQWYEDAGENGHPATDDYYDSEIVETYGNAADAASVQVLVSPTPDPVKPAGRGMFNCKICAQSFSFIDETAVHLLKSHCVILNECPYCQATSGDPSCLQVHIELSHKGRARTGEADTGPVATAIAGCVWCQKQLKHDGYCMVKKLEA